MGSTRRLPDDNQRRLDRLFRDNWRTQVASGSTMGVPGDETSPGDVVPPADAMPWFELADRLAAIEERLNNLEGVEDSG